MTIEITQLNTPLCLTGEGPLWNPADSSLYFVDFRAKAVLRFDPETEETDRWDVDSRIGSMAFKHGGGAVVALEDGIYELDFDTRKTRPLAMLPSSAAATQFNDGKVDREGRFIVGTIARDFKSPIAGIFRFDVDGTLTQIGADICLANGPCWSLDNRQFYMADSLRKTIYVYDYDFERGTVRNRRVFATTDDLGGMPDGMTIDAEGMLWAAICPNGKIACFHPDGALKRVIPMPISRPTSITFGGSALDRLFVTSLDAAQVLGEPHIEGNGRCFVIDGLGVVGVPEPNYRG